MARLTKDVHEKYMQDIMGHYENPDEIAPVIDALRSDFDEGIVEDTVPRSQYDDLKSKYISRFFGGDNKKDTAKDKQKEDVDDDKRINLTFDELFSNAEAYTGKDE